MKDPSFFVDLLVLDPTSSRCLSYSKDKSVRRRRGVTCCFHVSSNAAQAIPNRNLKSTQGADKRNIASYLYRS